MLRRRHGHLGKRWFDGRTYFANGGHARILAATHSSALDYIASEQAPVLADTIDSSSTPGPLRCRRTR